MPQEITGYQTKVAAPVEIGSRDRARYVCVRSSRTARLASVTAVARAWLSALERAREWEFARLTVPPLGTGAGNLALEDAAAIMATVLKSHVSQAVYPSDVCIVVETPEDREAFEAALRMAGAAES